MIRLCFMGKNTKPLQVYPLKELVGFKTKKLLALLKSARAVHSSILHHGGQRCCEECREYVGEDFENEVLKRAQPIKDYVVDIKLALVGREHVPSKAEKRKMKLERIKQGK